MEATILDENQFISIKEHSLWVPPFKLTDCCSEYMKNSPIPYSMLRNPFSKKKVQTDPVDEQKIWSLLGTLKNMDGDEAVKELTPTGLLGVDTVLQEPSLFYAKSVPSLQSKREIKRERKAIKKEKLSKWFDLPRGELTNEVKDDLELISKRRILGLDLHTKKSDGRRSHFQAGTVVDDPGSFYDRIPRKQRKHNLVDELLANADYMKKQRRQYSSVQKETMEKKLAIRRQQRQMMKKTGKTRTVTLRE